MQESPGIQKARQLIQAAKGRTLSLAERTQSAIELAGIMLDEAHQIQTPKEKREQDQLARMVNDPLGKVFTTAMTDQCFRSKNPHRVANQLVYVLKKFGIPKFLSWPKQLGLLTAKVLGNIIPQIIVPVTKHVLRKETSRVILPGEPKELAKHMQTRRKEGVRINLNHLGEAILGEEEAERRLQIYLNDLAKPEVEYISVKISTICSQLNLIAWEHSLEALSERLRQLYRAAIHNSYKRNDGTSVPKFVNLDMEEYRDLLLTVDLFCRTLDEPEFFQHAAGIVLQSYIPNSHLVQQRITEWAQERVLKGGAPVKIRIVKGANLAMEQVEASIHGWPQPAYASKEETDANFKRMVIYGCTPEHAAAAHLGIASHNLFDIAYALLLRAENQVEPYVNFEMLEGMADPMRRVVQTLSGDMLLYCPAATEEEFQNAIAYLVRRLDENTAPENFLRQAFSLKTGTPEWNRQAEIFSKSCEDAFRVSIEPRRRQNRFAEPERPRDCALFDNEPDTDWALPHNRRWAHKILEEWSGVELDTLPLMIGGKIIRSPQLEKRLDPSNPTETLYKYTLADASQVELALATAQKKKDEWSQASLEQRFDLLGEIAQRLREKRGDLIGAMIADTAKTIPEADAEVSEAIDFAEYYRRNLVEISSLVDIKWKSKGTVLVAPPWNFPCSIPAGGILAALATGNCVIFKPAPEAVLVGWLLAKIFWDSGVSPEVFQFITCEDDPIGSQLIKDPRISTVVLTGATSTAKLFLQMRPGLDLVAETGGKNAIIVTAMADRDLAIKAIIQSAFGYAGQKCSACSLAILEAEVYDDPHFRNQLRDAAKSLSVGSPWDPFTRVNPLIRTPNPALEQGLTILEEGEAWLLQPQINPDNPHLWSPGIKLGVKEGSFTHQTELFGPVLGIMRADNLVHAIKLANGTPYGLTSGIHTLDEREQDEWMKHIEAGNCYINRGITGAIVQRQPFGGCKQSSFGRGAKAGGPNYLMQLMTPVQVALPEEIEKTKQEIKNLTIILEKTGHDASQLLLWKASVGNYSFYWKNYFSLKHDPTKLIGEDNFFSYQPHNQIILRVQSEDQLIDILRVVAAALTCHTPLQISDMGNKLGSYAKELEKMPGIKLIKETEAQFAQRILKDNINRVRLLVNPSDALRKSLGLAACNVLLGPVLANGRLELLNYLREVSTSISYHRYGNLGIREGEPRKPLTNNNTCNNCHCHESK